jgi:hypothetical protein
VGLAILLNEITCTYRAGATQKVHSLRKHKHLLWPKIRGPGATTVPASVSGCAVAVQFSLTVHAVPSHSFSGFSFRVVASSARTIPAQMWADFVGVVHESVHVWVDFNFNAHGPLQLRRVSVSGRNQLPIRPVSGSMSSDSPVMNASRRAVTISVCTIPAQFFAAQMCVRSRCKCGKIRFRRSSVTDSMQLFGRINGWFRGLRAYVMKPTHKVSRCA